MKKLWDWNNNSHYFIASKNYPKSKKENTDSPSLPQYQKNQNNQIQEILEFSKNFDSLFSFSEFLSSINASEKLPISKNDIPHITIEKLKDLMWDSRYQNKKTGPHFSERNQNPNAYCYPVSFKKIIIRKNYKKVKIEKSSHSSSYDKNYLNGVLKRQKNLSTETLKKINPNSHQDLDFSGLTDGIFLDSHGNPLTGQPLFQFTERKTPPKIKMRKCFKKRVYRYWRDILKRSAFFDEPFFENDPDFEKLSKKHMTSFKQKGKKKGEILKRKEYHTHKNWKHYRETQYKTQK